MNCTYPYLYNNCTTSIADNLGRSYINFQICFMFISLISIGIVIYRGHIFYRDIGFKRNIVSICMILTFAISISLLIRSLDPEGYSGMISLLVETLCADIATISGFLIIYLYSKYFFKVRHLITGSIQSLSISKKRKLKCVSLLISSFVILILILSCLQVFINRNFYRGLKMFVYALLIITLMLSLVYNVHKVIQRLNFGTNTKKIQLLKRVRNIVSCFLILIGSSQIVSGYHNIRDKTDYIPPDKIGFNKMIFPLFQFITVVLYHSLIKIKK